MGFMLHQLKNSMILYYTKTMARNLFVPGAQLPAGASGVEAGKLGSSGLSGPWSPPPYPPQTSTAQIEYHVSLLPKPIHTKIPGAK